MNTKYLDYALIIAKYVLIPLALICIIWFAKDGLGWIVVLGVPVLALYVIIWFIKECFRRG